MIDIIANERNIRLQIVEHCRTLQVMPPPFPKTLEPWARKTLRADIPVSEIDDLLSAYISVGLSSLEKLVLNPPPESFYNGFGISLRMDKQEVSMAPFLTYVWNGEENRAVDEVLFLVRTSEEKFATYGATLEQFANIPKSWVDDGADDDC